MQTLEKNITNKQSEVLHEEDYKGISIKVYEDPSSYDDFQCFCFTAREEEEDDALCSCFEIPSIAMAIDEAKYRIDTPEFHNNC